LKKDIKDLKEIKDPDEKEEWIYIKRGSRKDNSF
jgi:hypothetical protein